MVPVKTAIKIPEYLKPWEKVLDIKEVEFDLPQEEISIVSALEKITGKPLANIEKGTIHASACTDTADCPELHAFETLFGRDSLITALDLKDIFPGLLKNTVLTLARYQGEKHDLFSEEEPGKMVHEVRRGDDPIAQRITKESRWQWPYYGSLDATLLYLLAIIDIVKKDPKFLYAEFKSKGGKTRTMRDSYISALEFILKKSRENPERLLEYKAGFKGSIENQVWKDSYDSYHHPDGTLANHKRGIASIEVQTLAYDALKETVSLDTPDNLKRESKELADNLKGVVLDKFWIEDDRGGYFALGADRNNKGALRPLKIRTSNMGWVLNSGILDGNSPDIFRKKEQLVKTLFSEEMLTDGGIRTLSDKEVRYSPGSYHNGSIWLFDNFQIRKGLARQGYTKEAKEIDKKLKNIYRELRVFPEFIRGNEKIEINRCVIDVWNEKDSRKNKLERPPQLIQAWSVSALYAVNSKKISMVA